MTTTNTAASTSDTTLDTSSHNGTSTPPPRRVRTEERQYQSEMMFIGQRCHWRECNREDFLPFRCADCQNKFCSEHYKTAAHHCSNPTPDFVVPQCPLCHEPPKQWKRDEDPNVAMDAHLTPNPKTGLIECTALGIDGKLQKQKKEKRENECNEKRCHKLMVVPIQCPQCHMRFCPSHRAPIQHQCVSLSTAKQSSSTSSSSPGSKLLDSLASKRANLQQQQQQQKVTGQQARTEKQSNLNAKVENLNPIRAIHAASNERKMDKWVPRPIFGEA